MKKSVLIVEDDILIRENVIEYFEFNGFQVYDAENGFDAIKIANNKKPDVIISDIMMPEMNGIEMLTELKKDSNTSLIPVILITAKVDAKDIREGMTFGADDYITKPFDLQDLLHSVNAQISKKDKITDHIHLEYTKSFEHWKNIANHELFTPINVIQNVYHLISNQTKFDDELDSIFKLSISRLKRTISNLLLLSGVYQIENNFKYTGLLEFNSQIQTILSEINELEKTNVANKFEIEFNLPEHFFIKDYFLLIIKEVLENAYKFSPSDSKIAVSFSIEEEMFVLKAKNKNKHDNTLPINSTRAFTQVERSNYEQQGLGLGLYIINRITSMFNDNFKLDQEGETVEAVWKSKIKFL